MNNMILLQKKEDGTIFCSQITEKGKEYVEIFDDAGIDKGYWEDGGTITLDEIDEILNREI